MGLRSRRRTCPIGGGRGPKLDAALDRSLEQHFSPYHRRPPRLPDGGSGAASSRTHTQRHWDPGAISKAWAAGDSPAQSASHAESSSRMSLTIVAMGTAVPASHLTQAEALAVARAVCCHTEEH